ncbi:MAG: (d)CMP kinase [Candidatus Dormibacteria bacterium]
MSTPTVVTVDGPAGSGKSTLGRRLGRALALPVIDSGLLYRGLTVAVVREGIDPADAGAVLDLALRTSIELNLDSSAAEPSWTVRVDGTDATETARDPRTALLLSTVSGIPEVRAVLLTGQRRLGAAGCVAMGRDCGTVVFPDAVLKLFLDAAGEVRANRRAVQLREAGASVDAGTLAEEIGGRDRLDRNRAVSPLRAAPDAHHIDTGDRSIESTFAEAARLCRAAGLPLVGEHASR